MGRSKRLVKIQKLFATSTGISGKRRYENTGAERNRGQYSRRIGTKIEAFETRCWEKGVKNLLDGKGNDRKGLIKDKKNVYGIKSRNETGDRTPHKE